MKKIIETNSEKVTQESKLIAEFMGFEPFHNNHYRCLFELYHNDQILPPQHMRFHSSFDWLMPVIDKLEQETGYGLVLGSDYAYWNKFGENPLDEEFSGITRLETAYEATIGLIQWHNSQK